MYRALVKRRILSAFSSAYLGVTIQLARETVVSEKVMLSHSRVPLSPSSSMIFRLLGDQVAQASTPPDSMAVTMLEASISMAVISSIVRPALARPFFRISSLEVPEE